MSPMTYCHLNDTKEIVGNEHMQFQFVSIIIFFSMDLHKLPRSEFKVRACLCEYNVNIFEII